MKTHLLYNIPNLIVNIKLHIPLFENYTIFVDNVTILNQYNRPSALLLYLWTHVAASDLHVFTCLPLKLKRTRSHTTLWWVCLPAWRCHPNVLVVWMAPLVAVPVTTSRRVFHSHTFNCFNPTNTTLARDIRDTWYNREQYNIHVLNTVKHFTKTEQICIKTRTDVKCN